MLEAKAFAQRVFGDQRVQLADDVAVMAEREVGLDPPLLRGDPELLEARALMPGERLRELVQRRPPPQGERATSNCSACSGLFSDERLPGAGDRPLKSGQVELVVTHLDQVPRRAGVQPRFRK